MIAFLILACAVLVHEMGHFIAARMVGVGVKELSVGFGPKLIGKQKGETMYSLRAVPLGGFCRLEGESSEEFKEYPIYKRAIVFMGGSVMNIIVGISCIFLVFFLFVGIPTETTTVGGGEGDKLQSGDKITAINNEEVTKWSEIMAYEETTSQYTIMRDGEIMMIEKESLQAVPKGERYHFSGSVVATGRTLAVLGENVYSTLSGSGEESDTQVVGPVGIVSMASDAVNTGDIVFIMFFIVSLNVGLGVANLLPLPILDGGHLFLLFFEKLKGSPFQPKVEMRYHAIGFIFIFMVVILVTINDIIQLLT